MENMNKKVKRMARGNARRKLWHRAVAIPAAIVVFVTTYALILPAIAMERDTYCGLEAHQHTAECYTAELACGYEDGAAVQDVQLVTELACGASAHQHTADCYDETGAVICGYADYLVHEHTADCYAADGTLVCPLPQVEAHTHDENCYIDETVNVCGMAESEGHIHTADCYSLVSHPELVCGMAESAGHIHTADCYTTHEKTYLACGLAESAGHIHGEGCYVTTVAEDGTETTELVCTEPESMGHTHTEACYATETVTELTCGQAESAGHTHTDACWANVETLELTCGQAESAGHTHTDACYATQKRLVCPKPEVILHTHNDDCYTVTVLEDGTENRELTCTQTVIEEHVHTADCFHTYEQTIERPHEHTDLCYIQTLTCILPEHEHTEECYVAPETPEVPETPEYICGLQGHTHTELCYDEAGELICGLEEHVHDETCLPVEIADGEPVEMGGEPDGNVQIVEDDTPAFQMPVLACGLAEHEHSTSCMDENMNYVCGLTAHAHTGDCYEIPGLAGVTPELVCDKHEHFHTEACYNENGEIACGLDEHTHGVGCFALPEGVADPDAAQAPGIDENTYWCGFEAHEHTEACLDANGETVCGLPEHQHTDQCLAEPAWYCGYEAHTHGESCFDETGALTCVLPEHTHSDACKVEPTWYCGKTAHTHGESCYDENGALICGLEEHVHTADCKVQHFTQMAYADGVMVTANYTSEAGLPIDAVLQVTRFTEGEHYEARVNEASEVFHAANPDQLFQPQALLNIGFYLPDGTEVEPAAPVDVTVQLVGEDGLAEGEQYTVIHYGAAGTELLDVAEGEDTAVNFTAESFSDFLINYDMDPSDGGSTVADGEQNEGEQQVDPSWAPFNPNYILGSFYSPKTSNGILPIYNSNTNSVFEHHKTIDYLGDNQKEDKKDSNNPDTTVDDKSDNEAVTDDLYRLYLDMEGESEPIDLLIVLDRSGSMAANDRDDKVSEILFGKNGESGLIGKFLEPNATAANDADKNYVAMVWYAGARAYDPSFEGDFRFSGNIIGPNAETEGGVSFYWANSMNGKNDIQYDFGKHIQGGTSNGNGWFADDIATNYVAGFVQAHNMLNDTAHFGEARKGHKQVVIFISDGVPTLYYESGEFEEAWNGNRTYDSLVRNGFGADNMTVSDLADNQSPQYSFTKTPPLLYNYVNTSTVSDLNVNNPATYGTAGKHSTYNGTNVLTAGNLESIWHSPYYTETFECFELFASAHTNINFFTIGIDMGSPIPDSKFYEIPGEHKFNAEKGQNRTTLLSRMAKCYGESNDVIQTTLGNSSLEDALRQIMFPSGVSISDDLSKYVTLYDPADVLVTATNKKNPNDSHKLWSGSVTNGQIIGEEMPENDDAILGNVAGSKIVENVTYDGETVTVHFRNGYCLNKNYKYTLSFNVRLTEEAYNEYAAMRNKTDGEYPDTGDGDDPATIGKTETTDYGRNKTSSGMPGFFSNDAANVHYTVDNNTYDDPYERPVVQCWGTRFKFLKTADDKQGGVAGMPFKLLKDGAVWEIAKDSAGNPISATDGWYLTDGNGYIDFGFLPCGEYTLVEKVREDYDMNVGLDRDEDTRVVTWMTFTVDKGRIINKKLAEGVTWESDLEGDTYNGLTVSGLPKDQFEGKTVYPGVNSTPNTDYFSGKAVLTVENKSYKQDLTIYKADEKEGTEEQRLSGAEFLLSRDQDNDLKTDDWKKLTQKELENYADKSGGVKINVDGTLVSGEDGLVFKGELPYGIYMLTEQKAPAGYDRLTESVVFTVSDTGITYDGEQKFAVWSGEDASLTLVIKDEPGVVHWNIRKTDIDDSPLTGAEFALYGPYPAADDAFDPETAGDPTWKGTTGSDGSFASAENPLPPLEVRSHYYLVETKAPDGFIKLDKPIHLYIEEKPVVDGEGVTRELKAYCGGESLMIGQAEATEGDTTYTLYTVTVQNTTGYELPESGGVGTTVYTLSGLAMLALAGAMFCANRRKSRT